MNIKKIRYYESLNYNPYINLSLEEKLMSLVGDDELIFYLWQNKDTVVIGKNQCAQDQCNLELMKENNITLARRSSGGGAVYHDLGNLNFTFIAKKNNFDINKNLEVIKKALEVFNIKAYFSGRNDLLVDGFKISGQAYLNKKDVSLHHGTLLVNVDLMHLGKYLKKDDSKLKIHGVKSFHQRVNNLSAFSSDIDIEKIKESLKDSVVKVFNAELTYQEIYDNELIEKYSSDSWLYKFTFDGVHIKKRFNYGLLDLNLKIVDNTIIKVLINSDIMDLDIIDEIEKILINQEFSNSLLDKIKLSNSTIENDLKEMLEEKLCTI